MNLLQNIISSIKLNGNFCIVGIDGPTASGKTTLADALAVSMKNKNIPCFIYRLDWTLIPREERLLQLDNYLENKVEFEYEADLHMNLDLTTNFLATVEKLRFKTFDTEHIALTGLYNRDNNGLCNGIAEADLLPGMVIIVEGHYTHHHKLRRYIDLNYLLIAGQDELLRRKIDRVGGYRNAKRTTDYFNYVDVPSFRNYFSRNIVRFRNIIFNEQFENQHEIGIDKVLKLFFSDSIAQIETSVYEKKYSSILELTSQNHDCFVQLWGIHPQYRDKGFTETLRNLLTNSDLNMVYLNVYMDNSNHFSYHYGLQDQNNQVLVFGSNKKIEVVYQNDYSIKMWRLQCCENARVENNRFIETSSNYSAPNAHYIWVPNRLLLPRFLENEDNCEKQYYQDASNALNSLTEIFMRSCFCVFRPESDQESDFMLRFFSIAGFAVQHINGYIFAENLCEKRHNDSFDNFISGFVANTRVWSTRFPNEKDIAVLEKCGCVFKDNDVSFTEKTDFAQLATQYKKLSLNTKKLLTEYLRQAQPNVEIASGVNIATYIESLPATLSEIYFALSVSGMGAIPFISVYDLKETGLDVSTYFNYFSDMSMPFGIQASLNALGTDAACGYLQVKGPGEMAVSIRKQIIKFLRNHPGQKLPIWGLGIDHAVIKTEESKLGQSFLHEAALAQLFTSFCIDLTALLDADNKKIPDCFSEQIANLLLPELIPDCDIEFYVGDEKFFENLSVEQSLLLYSIIASLLSDYLKNNNYPSGFLLGPFLGTLHHQLHNRLDPELSDKIYKACSVFGVMGNVLHGTSFTPYDSIKQLVKHACIRVNFAGKFLFALVNGFPPHIKNSFGTRQTEIKNSLSRLNPIVAKNAKPSITESVGNELSMMSEAGVGIAMSAEEQQWFRKSHVFLPDTDFSKIMDNLSKLSIKGKPIKTGVIYLASMIEVPYDIFVGGLVKRLVKNGITHFHVDMGDGEYISRKLDGLEKLIYLQKYFPDCKTHLHLMIKNPFDGNGKSFVSQLAEIKQSLIYLHPEAYDNALSWKYGTGFIRKKDCIPGIVLSIDEKVFTGALLEKMRQADLHYLLVMGVAIGRGGQSFQSDTISKIEFIREWSVVNHYEIVIEVDGGLSDCVIDTCISAGAMYLSGWSLFLKYGIENIEKRVNELLNGKN